MLTAFTLALGQLGDRKILAVLGKSLALTLAVFAILGVLARFAILRVFPAESSDSTLGGLMGWMLAGVVFLIGLLVYLTSFFIGGKHEMPASNLAGNEI